MAQQRTLRRLRNRSPYRARSARQGGQWTPNNLAPFAWYDAQIGGSSTQITDSSGNGRAAATFGAGANSPLYLAYSGTPYVYVSGVAGNFVSSATAAWAPLQDMEIIVEVTPDAWSPAANQTLIAMWTSPLQWTLDLRVGGTFRFTWVDSTPTTRNFDSTAHGLTGSSRRFVRVRVDADNGAGGTSVQFATSTDGVTYSVINTATLTTSLAARSGTSTLTVGAQSSSSQTMSGLLHSAVIRNATSGGTAVAQFDAVSCGQTGYTGPLGNVWTVNRSAAGRKTVVLSPAANSTRSVILLGTDDWIDVPAAAIPPTRAAAASYVIVGRQWATPVSGGHYFNTDNSGMALTTNTTSLQGRAVYNATGLNTASTYTAGTRFALLGAYNSATTTLSTALNLQARQTNAAVAAPASDPTAARIGATTAGATFQDFELTAFLTVNRVLSDGELASLVAFYLGGV